MVVAITATPVTDGFYVDYHVTGLTAGTKYDVYRLQLRYMGDDDTGVPQYERELPDRRALWSALAHRVGWTAPTGGIADFRDYESPLRPHSLFVVPSASGSPFDYDFSVSGPYPLTRGTLCATVVHFNRTLTPQQHGLVMMRSTAELGLWVDTCVYDLDVRYPARGSEMAVMGRQYPMYVADTREARRGTLTLSAQTLGDLYDIRRIVFPPDGTIRPVVLNSGADNTMLLDDLTLIPLDVQVQQATRANASIRWVLIDYVEVDPASPLVQRAGDNDLLVTAPKANFTVSDTTPKRHQWITLTDTSTGQFDTWDWTVERAGSNPVSKFATQGPQTVMWTGKGTYRVTLRVYGSNAGASTKTVRITVS
jgi:hypothetical protein